MLKSIIPVIFIQKCYNLNMKKKILIANWKLNPLSLVQAKALLSAVNKTKSKHEVVICPPYVYIGLLKTKFKLGVQDLFWQDSGAYTGQISGPMLKEFNAKYAIIGHSELRAIGESDHEINLKLQAALRNKIIPILCVGYGVTASDTEEDILFNIQSQLANGLEDISKENLSKIIVAYEPVWAIGTGKAADPEHAERVAMFIKIKFKISKVLYGGSSNADNAKSFLEKSHIDGLLIGGASLIAEDFKKIISI